MKSKMGIWFAAVWMLCFALPASALGQLQGKISFLQIDTDTSVNAVAFFLNNLQPLPEPPKCTNIIVFVIESTVPAERASALRDALLIAYQSGKTVRVTYHDTTCPANGIMSVRSVRFF